MVPRMGFDPMISTLKGWRPNLARRPGHTYPFYYNCNGSATAPMAQGNRINGLGSTRRSREGGNLARQ